jgi:hypothetical protein
LQFDAVDLSYIEVGIYQSLNELARAAGRFEGATPVAAFMLHTTDHSRDEFRRSLEVPKVTIIS